MSLQDLYEQYHDQVAFFNIYIREAHPVDGWWFGRFPFNVMLNMQNSRAATDVYDPKTIEERRAVAGRCEKTLQYGIPTLVDEMDDAVNTAYGALPTRLYLIDIEGRVNYAGGPGPWGFKPPELEAAIRSYLAELETQRAELTDRPLVSD